MKLGTTIFTESGVQKLAALRERLEQLAAIAVDEDNQALNYRSEYSFLMIEESVQIITDMLRNPMLYQWVKLGFTDLAKETKKRFHILDGHTKSVEVAKADPRLSHQIRPKTHIPAVFNLESYQLAKIFMDMLHGNEENNISAFDPNTDMTPAALSKLAKIDADPVKFITMFVENLGFNIRVFEYLWQDIKGKDIDRSLRRRDQAIGNILGPLADEAEQTVTVDNVNDFATRYNAAITEILSRMRKLSYLRIPDSKLCVRAETPFPLTTDTIPKMAGQEIVHISLLFRIEAQINEALVAKGIAPIQTVCDAYENAVNLDAAAHLDATFKALQTELSEEIKKYKKGDHLRFHAVHKTPNEGKTKLLDNFCQAVMHFLSDDPAVIEQGFPLVGIDDEGAHDLGTGERIFFSFKAALKTLQNNALLCRRDGKSLGLTSQIVVRTAMKFFDLVLTVGAHNDLNILKYVHHNKVAINYAAKNAEGWSDEWGLPFPDVGIPEDFKPRTKFARRPAPVEVPVSTNEDDGRTPVEVPPQPATLLANHTRMMPTTQVPPVAESGSENVVVPSIPGLGSTPEGSE